MHPQVLTIPTESEKGCYVTVAPHPPVALVGPDQALAEASLVTLDGSASFDPDADPLTFLWQQVSGP